MSRRGSKSQDLVPDLEKCGDISSLPSSVKGFFKDKTVANVQTGDSVALLMYKQAGKDKPKPYYFVLGQLEPTIYYFEKSDAKAKVKGVIRLTDTTTYQVIQYPPYRYAIEINTSGQSFNLMPNSELDQAKLLAKLDEVICVHYPSKRSAISVRTVSDNDSTGSIGASSSNDIGGGGSGKSNNTSGENKPIFSEYSLDLVKNAAQQKGSPLLGRSNANIAPVAYSPNPTNPPISPEFVSEVPVTMAITTGNNQYVQLDDVEEDKPEYVLPEDVVRVVKLSVPSESEMRKLWNEIIGSNNDIAEIKVLVQGLGLPESEISVVTTILEATLESNKIDYIHFNRLKSYFGCFDTLVKFVTNGFYPGLIESDMLKYLTGAPIGTYLVTCKTGERAFNNVTFGRIGANGTIIIKTLPGTRLCGFKEERTQNCYLYDDFLKENGCLNPLEWCDASQSWYHGSIDSNETSRLFNLFSTGIEERRFLVRNSSTGNGITLSIYNKKEDTITSYRLSGLKGPISEVTGKRIWNDMEGVFLHFNLDYPLESSAGRTRKAVELWKKQLLADS